ncbi:MAG: hypothetical protein KBS57_03710 [Alistipes sp.]|nr:hypothetical protein [Candidatus Minthomonas equi]
MFVVPAWTGISAQDSERKSPEEIAIEWVSKMETQLELEPHQTFYADSILTHDYRAWMDEIEELQKSGASESSLYLSIKQKWDNRIDSAMMNILSPEQFVNYQKMMGRYKKPKKSKKSNK